MRILFITKYAWDDKLAGGNTLSNLFSSWPNTEYFTIYCREALPNNKCCSEYYSISPINILKNIFTPQKIGKRFTLSGNEVNNVTAKTEDALKSASKKHKFAFELIHDLMYASKIWLNKKLKRFIAESNPDIVFCFGVPDAFTYQMVKYVKKHLTSPIVAYYVDDHYNNNAFNWNVLHRIGRKRLKGIALMADKRYAISQMMCDEYAKEMNHEFSLLVKGCVTREVRTHVNSTLRFVYAGNLLYRRDHILADIVSTLKEINAEESNRTRLDIYTSSPVNEGMYQRLCVAGVSEIHSAKPYEVVMEIMHNSDVVLFVESFDQEQINTVRLSFSTKITDCLQSGAKVLAVGPSEIASIDYLKCVPGVSVVPCLDKLSATILSIINNPSNIINDAKDTSIYSRKNLTIKAVRDKLQNDLMRLVSKGN